MASRSREILNKVVRRAGERELTPRLLEELKKCIPSSKIGEPRAKLGIYAGERIKYGDQVSEKGGNRTRRTWKPNVQSKRLFSYIFDRPIQVEVTTRAIHLIDEAGGFDEYFLKTPYRKLDTELEVAWKAKIEEMYMKLGPLTADLILPKNNETKPLEGNEDENPV